MVDRISECLWQYTFFPVESAYGLVITICRT